MNHTYDEVKELLKLYMDIDYIEYIDKYYNEAVKIYEGLEEDNLTHVVNVAYILADLRMDPITIGCSLIHEAISLDLLTYEEIEDKFGTESANIIQSVTKISNLRRTFKVNDPEKYRRIVIGLSENPSTLFIKLADRLDNLKLLSSFDKERIEYIINDTQNVYIPIAHRLGLKKIKSEMEDLCLRVSAKEEYEEILNKINSSSEALENALLNMRTSICEILDSHNIEYKILSRVKSVRGIYNKLHNGKSWDDIYDLLGLRVLVNTVEECYRVIGLIQSVYEMIPSRFKDFIANPKANGYQSLHTTVYGYEGRKYEIQIRTYDMDLIAEKGIASHWSYKEKISGNIKTSVDSALENLRTLIELNDIESNMEFFSNMNEALKKDEIYVYTPKGDVIELPIGSTPIDFAYKIHSEVGNQTTGALVNNKMVKLDYILKDEDKVELITQKGHVPSKNWLNVVKTDNAKSRIKAFFYKSEREKYISLGKEMLSLECKKKNIDINEVLKEENIEKLKKSLSLDSLNDIYFNISTLRYLPSSILSRLEIKKNIKKEKRVLERKTNNKGILIGGQDDILCSFADCCKPVYGEDIVGFITRGYGVKIHSKNCSNINLDSDRLIEAKWNYEVTDKYKSKIYVYVSNESSINEELISIATKYDINVDNTKLIKRNNDLFYDINLRVCSIDKLNNFIEQVKLINNVIKVERVFL